MRVTPRAIRALLLTIVVIGSGVAATGCIPPPPPTPTVVVYGDSLVHESVAELEQRLQGTFPGWKIIVHAWGGLAQCDLHSDMINDVDHNNVRVAILAFVGNALSPCATSRPYPDSYVADANWAADYYASKGVSLAFVATPGRAGTTPAQRIVPNVYRSVGTGRGIAVVDYDDLFVDPATGRYEQTGPCLVGECSGSIDLRAPDGGHLCPIPGSVPCAVYSSGVVRYVDAIVQMAASLGRVAAPARRVMLTTTSTTSTTTTSTTTTSTTSTTTTSTTMGSTASSAPGGTDTAPGGAPSDASGVASPAERITPPYAPLGDSPP